MGRKERVFLWMSSIVSPKAVPAHTEHIHVAMVFPLGEIHVLEMDLPSLAILLLPAPTLWTLQVFHLLPWYRITHEI